jgi:CP family cyanate transporter-like MFS transporter
MVPLANALGGWREAFAFSAIPTVICLPLWLLLPRTAAMREEGGSAAVLRRKRAETSPPARVILVLAAVFGLQSVCFAAVTNWVATLYHDHGWSPSAASLTTALVSILIIPGALAIPALSDRGDRRKWALGAAAVMAVGMFGLAFAPTAAAWLWLVAFGIGNGALFTLALTLPQDMAEDERTRTVLTGWTLGLGYTLSGMGPLIVGGLLDLTGGFAVPMALLGAMGIFSGVFALVPTLKRHLPARALGVIGDS